MKITLRSLGLSLAAGLIGLMAATAPAHAVTIYLNNSNTLADGPAYVQVDITGGGTNWTLTFDALTPPLSAPAAGGNFGIQDVGFNIPTATATIGVPAGWTSAIDTTNGIQRDGFGQFDVSAGDGPGGGNVRFDPVSVSVTFAVAQSAGWWEEFSTGGNGGWWITAHVAGFNSTPCNDPQNNNVCTSAWFATADNGFPPTGLPEPGGLLIVVTAMGLLAVFLRRRGTA